MATTPVPYSPAVHDIVLYLGYEHVVWSLGGVGSMNDVPIGSGDYLSHEPTALLVEHGAFKMRIPTRLLTDTGKRWVPESQVITAAPVPASTRDLIQKHLADAPEGLTISQLAYLAGRPSAAVHSSLQSLKTAGVVVQGSTDLHPLVWKLAPADHVSQTEGWMQVIRPAA